MIRGSGSADGREEPDRESGPAGSRSNPRFVGPVDPPGWEDPNAHFALLYDDPTEQFDAAVPFLERGLERGQRCLYVADEHSGAEVRAAMHARGVDAVQESDALTVYSGDDTDGGDGGFDPDGMIAFLESAIDAVTEAGDYAGLCVAGEMTRVLGETPSREEVLAYEARLDRLLSGTDCAVLCQYDRGRFPPAVVRDVVSTHPYVASDGTVWRNRYNSSSEECTGSEWTAREVDRTLETLLDRTEDGATPGEWEAFLRRQTEVVADGDRSVEETVRALLENGREWFGADVGYVATVDREADGFEVVESVGARELLGSGTGGSLSESHCSEVVEAGGPLCVTDPGTRGLSADPAFGTDGLDTFLGTTLVVDGDLYGTLCFADRHRRDGSFTDGDATVVELLSQLLRSELERRGREDRLSVLNTLARDLTDAETAAEVGESVVDAAASTLDPPVAAVARYDEREGVLTPTARTGAGRTVIDATSLLAVGDTPGWEAFVHGEARRVRDPVEDPAPRSSVTEVAVLPLDRYGVFVAGTTAVDGFDAAGFDFLETVAATASSAIDRVRRERQHEEREATLAEQTEALERISRVNDVVRSIDRALVRSSSRAEIEAIVCEHLADSGPYEMAWIGEHDATSQSVTPTEWAGGPKGYLDGIDVTTDGSPTSRGPTGQAVVTGEPRVVDDVLADSRSGRWRRAALDRGYHAVAALPLQYDGTLYGVLNVYAGEPDTFGDLERSVLAEMAETVAGAFDAVERASPVGSGGATELEFRVSDRALGPVELACATGSRVRLAALSTRSDGEVRAFVTVLGASPADVLATVPDLPVSDVSLLAETDADEPVCLFSLALAAGSVGDVVTEHGGSLREATVTDGEASVLVTLASGTDVSSFVDAFTTAYPGAQLVARRRRDRPGRSDAEFLASLTEDLTPRQFEALQSAYVGGYFEQPRERTASEIAETMAITQPTFTAHLRGAQLALCRRLFGAGPDDA